MNIFKIVKQQKLIDENSINKSIISDSDLDKIWSKLFRDVEWILFTDLINPQTLLMWLKTTEGKARLKAYLESERHTNSK